MAVIVAGAADSEPHEPRPELCGNMLLLHGGPECRRIAGHKGAHLDKITDIRWDSSQMGFDWQTATVRWEWDYE